MPTFVIFSIDRFVRIRPTLDTKTFKISFVYPENVIRINYDDAFYPGDQIRLI